MKVNPPPSVMKRTREQSTEGETLVVNQAAVCSLMHFYDSDPVVQLCQNNLNATVFDGQYTYFIGLRETAARGGGRRRFGAEERAEELDLFNSAMFLDQLRNTLVRSRAHLRVWGGFAIWAVRDLARWLQHWANASDDAERRTIGLPFGVLEVWEYTLEVHTELGHHRRFVVHPLAPRTECHYTFYDYQTTLLPVNGDDVPVFERRAAPLLVAMQQSGGAAGSVGAGGARQRVPQSAFYYLNTLREQVDEAYMNLADADWLSAHPKPLIRVGTPAPVAQEHLSEKDLYTSDSVLEASLKQRRRLRAMSLQDMANILSSMRRAEGLAPHGTTLRQQQRRFYRHPDMLEDAELMDESSELAHWHEPRVVNDYARCADSYRIAVVTAMGLGEHSRIAQAILGKLVRDERGVDTRTHLGMLVEQNERNALVESEQKIYQRLFNVFYEFAGFAEHDMRVVSDVVGALDAVIAGEEARRAALRALARRGPAAAAATGTDARAIAESLLQKDAAAAAQTPVVEHDAPRMARKQSASKKKQQQQQPPPHHPSTKEDSAATTHKAEEGDADDILLRMKVRLNDLRAWLVRVRETTRQQRAELIFENKEDDTILLQFMLEMHARGVLDVSVLEKQAQRVYDARITLREATPTSEKREADDTA